MKTFLLRAAYLFILSGFITNSFSQAGTIDSSFGINGKVTTTISPGFNGCRDIVLKPDGKIITLGNNMDWPNPNRLTIAQYLQDGKLDPSFGNNGLVSTSFNFGVSIFIASSIVVQPDGKIIAGGGIYHDFGMTEYFVLVRYQANGTIDSTFGVNGFVFTYIGPYPKENFLNKLYLQTNGKILAGGSSDGFCLIRYNPDGSLDSTFGDSGIFTNREGDGGIAGIAVQPDGKVIIAGGTWEYYLPESNTVNSDFKIMRLSAAGDIDSAFGVNGVARTDFFNSFDQITSVKVLQDGGILTSGIAFNESEYKTYSVFARYRNDGRLDSTFSSEGKLITQSGNNFLGYMGTLLVQPDGKFLIAGSGNVNQIYIARYNKDESPDLSFGSGGSITESFEGFSNAHAAILQADGKIIVGGGADFKLARFKGDEPITISFVKNVSVVEGNTSMIPAQFKVALNKPSASDVFVNYTTKDLTASAGADYIAASGTLRIRAGKTKGTIRVNIIGDNTKEKTEGFALVLSNPINAVLGNPDSITCAIKNDDPSFAKANESSSITVRAIKVYPNPVVNELKIGGLSSNTETAITILDMNGKAIYTGNVIASAFIKNVAGLKAGTYFVRIENANNTKQIFKFIKL